MPSPREVAAAHAAFRRRLALAVAAEAKSMWSQVDPARIQQSWVSAIGRLMILVSGAQRAVAGQADGYLDEILTAQDVDPDRERRIATAAFSGIASDGRSLQALLYQPVISALTGIQRGTTPARSLAGGQAVLDMIVRTQIADAGRTADQVALTARRQATGYVRMLVGGSCSRCAVLAGRRYAWSTGFDRHPRCDCIHIPAREDSADDLRTNPRRYFESLPAAEQDRAFTKAGAEAIRNGADIGQVVNARRGMQTATVFGREVLLTTEGTTLRGNFGRARRDGPLVQRAGQRVRSTARVRLMPEQILVEAKGDRDEAIRLLRVHGYLI